jgi:hypothetical protein
MVLAFTTVSASGSEQLRLVVSPAQSFAPSNLHIRAHVVPHAENRTLTVLAESEDFYRSSEISLEGDRAPTAITVEFRGLPGGDYLVSGKVTDSAGRQRAIVERQVRVLSISGH